MLRYKKFWGDFSPLAPPPSCYAYVRVKVKVKFTLEQAMKAQRGTRGTALFFL